ncbi:MAG: c-type cytochrome [Akkermansia sp.]|nr:c-type cytochrome [Akkermansia sp.]
MKLKPMLCASAAVICCLLAFVSCRRDPDVVSGPVAPVDVKVVDHLVAVLGHESRTLELVDPASGEKVKSIRLGQPPNGMAIDGVTAYVAEGGPCGVVEVVDLESGARKGSFPAGNTPMSPVLRGGKLYVACRFDSKIVEMDASTGNVLNSWSVPREPVALAVSPDGRKIWAAGHLPAGTADGDFTAAALTLVEDGKTTHFPLSNGTQGVRGMAASPDGRYLAVAHVLSRYQVPTTQLDRGWMNTNAVTIIDTERPDKPHPVLLDDPDAGAANPWGVLFSGDGGKLLVTHAGTHELSVIDFPVLLERMKREDRENEPVSERLGFLHGLRLRVPLPLNGPRALASDGKNVYVAGYFSDTLAEVPLKAGAEPRKIALNGDFRPSREKMGEQYFNDASHCFQGWQSCATCHPDGRVDGLNWDLLNDGMGNPKNTRTMFLSHRTSPVMTLGVRASAEVAVTAGFVHIQFLEPSRELAECVNEYLKNMKEVPSPFLTAQTPSKSQTRNDSCIQCHAPGVERGALSESARRGKEIFKTAGCVNCHPHPYFTTKELIATGTARGLDEGKSILVPSLVEVWRTAPYLHDGRAKTIREAVTTHNPGDLRGKTSGLNDRDLEDLINYVQSL